MNFAEKFVFFYKNIVNSASVKEMCFCQKNKCPYTTEK